MDIQELKRRDEDLKGGPAFNRESEHLTAIYQGQGKGRLLSHLKKQGQGDPDLRTHPFQTKLLRRLVQTVAVVWSQSPTRIFSVQGERLPDTSAHVRNLADVYQRGRINSYLKTADRWRALLGQVIVYLSPNPRARVEPRLYQPHLVLRDPDDSNQDDMSTDRAVAFQIRCDSDPKKEIWHLWEQVNPGDWEARRVNGAGEDISGPDAIYPGATPPFGGAPFLQIYDELPEGRAWVPIDETRTAFSVGQNTFVNELAYLLKQEAHTVVTVSGTEGNKELPSKWGPGEIWGFTNPEAKAEALKLDPKLLESIGVSRHLMELFAAGEGLPADYFLASRRYETGASGRLRQQDLEARRQDQVQDAILSEVEVFDILREIHNAHADFGPAIPEEIRMQPELTRPHFPVDTSELQGAWDFDMARGLGSAIDYLVERHRFTREQAILFYHRVQDDLAAYPIHQPSETSGATKSEQGIQGRPPVDDGLEGPDHENLHPMPHHASPLAAAS
jgi:hypothetical protein